MLLRNYFSLLWADWLDVSKSVGKPIANCFFQTEKLYATYLKNTKPQESLFIQSVSKHSQDHID